MRILLLWITPVIFLWAVEIIDKPILFTKERIALTKEYINTRYQLEVSDITIIPRMIVIHATALDDFENSYARFYPVYLPSDRTQIKAVSQLNVSAHFMIDREGNIFRLMPETWMARHTIGLNFSAIGIENVGGKNHQDDLTSKQLQANIQLIHYLTQKYKSIDYLIGHYEYTAFEGHPLWLEKSPHYRTRKYDPGKNFMKSLRATFITLKGAP